MLLHFKQGGILKDSIENQKAISTEIIIVGAGLVGLIMAYAFRNRHPHIDLLVLEKERELVGDRTWSFHQSDIDDFNFWEPLIDYRWDSYKVDFGEQKRIDLPYCTIRSGSFFKKMRTLLGSSLVLGVKIEQTLSTSVISSSQIVYKAPIIIDTRFSSLSDPAEFIRRSWGFQKFVGLELKLKNPHRLLIPILMDANVEQKDGYRFFYVLPYSENTLLIEETYYSNHPELMTNEINKTIEAYTQRKGWIVDEVLSRESGVLPIPTSSHFSLIDFKASNLHVGACVGFYQPVTGYSTGWAFRMAGEFSGLETVTRENLIQALERLRRQHQKTESFYLFLNKLLFWCSDIEDRKNIFQHVYSMPLSLVRNLYNSKTRIYDRVRLFLGRPPIPPWRVYRAFFSERQISNSNEIRKES